MESRKAFLIFVKTFRDMHTQVITLPIGNIIITIERDEEMKPTSGTITHDLVDDDEDTEFNAAMDGITSMVLAHAMADVDVQSAGYLEGLDTAISACESNFP